MISISELGPLLVAAGVLTALVTFVTNIQRSRSDDLLRAATELLEKAYEKLAPTDNSSQPNNNRIAWLSAARLIITAEKLSKGITEDSHRLIYQEKKEYWRIRLYELIFPSTEGLPSSFYAEHPEHMIGYLGEVRSPISEKSLAFLYRFIRWPEDVPDPLAKEPVLSESEIYQMVTFGPRGLGELLTEVRRIQTPETNEPQPTSQSDIAR